jgi:hypothetical protein
MIIEPVKRAKAIVFHVYHPLRGLKTLRALQPRVPLRCTRGFMLSPASQAPKNIIAELFIQQKLSEAT